MNNQKSEIRVAPQKDVELLSVLGTKTFYETYAYAHSEEDMSAYLKDVFNKERILNGIEDKNTTFLIYDIDNTAVGYVKLTNHKQPDELKGLKSIELRRIYVVKEMIGRGIGKALMQKSLEISKNKGFEVIWLSVWERNLKAIAFYEKFGFETFGNSVFKLGKATRDLLLMKKESLLNPN